jgi:ketosteroid isomerase-like protein
MASAQSEVLALLKRRVDACRAKDIDRLMALYSPHIVYFDVVPPLKFVGTDAVKRNFLRWFGEYAGPIGLETYGLEIAVSEGVAFAHMFHLDKGNTHLEERGNKAGMWVRSTACCQRSNHGWLITHEHISLPIDFRTGNVVMNLEP